MCACVCLWGGGGGEGWVLGLAMDLIIPYFSYLRYKKTKLYLFFLILAHFYCKTSLLPHSPICNGEHTTPYQTQNYRVFKFCFSLLLHKKNIYCGYSLETPLRGPSNNYHNPLCCRDKDINIMCVSMCVCVIYLFVYLFIKEFIYLYVLFKWLFVYLWLRNILLHIL